MTIKDESSAFKEMLWQSDFPDKVKDLTSTAVRGWRKYLHKDSANLGPTDSRVKREMGRRISKTLKHLKNAVRHAGEHEDSNIRTKAKKLIRSVHRLSYEEIEAEASRFHGSLQKAGRRQMERQRRAKRSRITFENDIVQLTRVEQLILVGRELDLCVARSDNLGRRYHDDLRNKTKEFYYGRRNDRSEWLMSVDTESRKVEEFRGHGNQSPDLTRHEALDILKALKNVTADENEVFSSVGAYSDFLDGVPKVPVIRHDGRKYKVRPFPGTVVIASRPEPSGESAGTASAGQTTYREPLSTAESGIFVILM